MVPQCGPPDADRALRKLAREVGDPDRDLVFLPRPDGTGAAIGVGELRALAGYVGRRDEVSARSHWWQIEVWAATRRAGLDYHAFAAGDEEGTRSQDRTRCSRSTLSATSITFAGEDDARASGLKPCPRCYPTTVDGAL